jgi:hypothetical protein
MPNFYLAVDPEGQIVSRIETPGEYVKIEGPLPDGRFVLGGPVPVTPVEIVPAPDVDLSVKLAPELEIAPAPAQGRTQQEDIAATVAAVKAVRDVIAVDKEPGEKVLAVPVGANICFISLLAERWAEGAPERFEVDVNGSSVQRMTHLLDLAEPFRLGSAGEYVFKVVGPAPWRSNQVRVTASESQPEGETDAEPTETVIP